MEELEKVKRDERYDPEAVKRMIEKYKQEIAKVISGLESDLNTQLSNAIDQLDLTNGIEEGGIVGSLVLEDQLSETIDGVAGRKKMLMDLVGELCDDLHNGRWVTDPELKNRPF